MHVWLDHLCGKLGGCRTGAVNRRGKAEGAGTEGNQGQDDITSASVVARCLRMVGKERA